MWRLNMTWILASIKELFYWVWFLKSCGYVKKYPYLLVAYTEVFLDTVMWYPECALNYSEKIVKQLNKTRVEI